MLFVQTTRRRARVKPIPRTDVVCRHWRAQWIGRVDAALAEITRTAVDDCCSELVDSGRSPLKDES